MALPLRLLRERVIMSTTDGMLNHMGGVPVGTQRFYGWWSGTSYFVDYDSGVDANTGLGPAKAKKNLATALSLAVAGDVIYIRPRPVLAADTDPQYIVPATAANWNVPRTKYNLSIVGAGPQLGSGQIHQTYLRGESTVTGATLGSSTLTVRAPYCSIENLAFHLGGSTRGQVEFYGDGTSTANAWGSSVSNCLFRFGATDFGGLYIVDSWYCGAYKSHFYRNQVGVRGVASQSTLRGIKVKNCEFDGDTTALDANIALTGSGIDWGLIDSCRFNNGLPALSAGAHGVYINVGATTANYASMISDCYFNIADLNTSTDLTLGSGWLDIGCYDSTNAHIA